MSHEILNRMTISPSYNHREINNYLRFQLGIEYFEYERKKDQLRFEFITLNRCATTELFALKDRFPNIDLHLVWSDDQNLYARGLSFNDQKIGVQTHIRWGINDYLTMDEIEDTEDTELKESSQTIDFDWTALEYDLIKASQQDGFLENSKIIPVLSTDQLIQLLSQDEVPIDSSSANACVMHLLSEKVDLSKIPTHHLNPTVLLEALQYQLINFSDIPDQLRTKTFLIAACLREGKAVYSQIPRDQREDELHMAALESRPHFISLKDIPAKLRKIEMIEVALQNQPQEFAYIPKKLITQALCNQYPLALQHIPIDFKTADLCQQALLLNASLLAYVPKPFITKRLLNQVIRQTQQPNLFLQFIQKDLLQRPLVNAILRKNPQEFRWLPEEFKTLGLCKRYIIKHIENLPYAPTEWFETLRQQRTIKRLFHSYPSTLDLIPKAFLNEALVFDLLKANAIELHEVPNAFLQEEMITLAIRRLKRQQKLAGHLPIRYDALAQNTAKENLWKRMPEKYKDYDFCREALRYCHPNVAADILLYLLLQTPRELAEFNDSMQWLHFFIDQKMTTSFKDKFAVQTNLAQHLEKMSEDTTQGDQPFKQFVNAIMFDIPHTKKQRKAYRSISEAAWNLWIETCQQLYNPTNISLEVTDTLLPIKEIPVLDYTKPVKILNVYLQLGQLASSDQPPLVEVAQDARLEDDLALLES